VHRDRRSCRCGRGKTRKSREVLRQLREGIGAGYKPGSDAVTKNKNNRQVRRKEQARGGTELHTYINCDKTHAQARTSHVRHAVR
jgi:hypothetical protein